jgi:hypothetical protein
MNLKLKYISIYFCHKRIYKVEILEILMEQGAWANSRSSWQATPPDNNTARHAEHLINIVLQLTA